MRELVCILSTPVDVLDTSGVMARLEQFIEEKRFHQVATANADFLINAMADAELRQILRDSDLVTPDGMPLVWASKKLGKPLSERVTGADMVPALAELAARKGYRLYMLGAQPAVAQAAQEKMEAAYPGLQIVGRVSPPLQPLDQMDSSGILREIQAARPDVLLVAFGNPKQEKWIYRNREALRDVPVCIGVGGTFDFIAGNTQRAPQWIQKSGMEWMFRLLQEPRRLWKRYTRDIGQFGRHFGAQWRAAQIPSGAQAAEWTEARQGDSVVLSVTGALDQTQQSALQERAKRIFDLPADCILDLTRADYVDAAIVGALLNLPRAAQRAGRALHIAGANPRVLRALHAAHTEEALTFYPTPVAALQAGSASGKAGQRDPSSGEEGKRPAAALEG